MLKQLPIKKDHLLIGAALVLLLACYEFAFKNTIEAWQAHSQLKAKLTQSADLSVQPAYVERKSKNLDKVISLYKADTTQFRSNIISTIAGIADKENVKLAEVPVQDATYHTDHFIIEKLDFEGDYFSLLKLANDLQSTGNIGVIRSEDWKVTGVKSPNDDMKKLVLEVYLEIAR